MPELPEVETVVRSLRDGGQFGPSAVGRVIQSVFVDWPKTIAEPDVETFCQRLIGRRISTITRRGKHIIIHLDQGDLLVHLRMSGDLRIEKTVDDQNQPNPVLPHDRVVITFEDGFRMAFNNPRKFGRMWLVEDAQQVVSGLGPEPLDESLTAEKFIAMLHKHKRQIKPLLMDQTFIAGMGNIYTDEALFLSKIHPLTRSNQLSNEQAALLLASMRKVLLEGIRRNGSSIDWVYRGGEFQNDFQVYQRTGEECLVCSTPIKRIVVGQRGTHYCPHCQLLMIEEEA